MPRSCVAPGRVPAARRFQFDAMLTKDGGDFLRRDAIALRNVVDRHAVIAIERSDFCLLLLGELDWNTPMRMEIGAAHLASLPFAIHSAISRARSSSNSRRPRVQLVGA